VWHSDRQCDTAHICQWAYAPIIAAMPIANPATSKSADIGPSSSTSIGGTDRLQHFPVPFFAVVMGLAGLTLAWKRAEVVFHPPFAVSCYLEFVSAAAFAIIALTYALKLARYPVEVMREWRHPVRINFFPTISIGLILLSIVFVDRYFEAARVIWVFGSGLQIVFTIYVINAWIHRSNIEVGHVNPAWFIPVVGNVLVPIAGVRFFPPEISWFFFSVGIVFWIVLLTIVMNRLFLHAPLPERMLPSLFILVAPPAVATISWFALNGSIGPFGRILYYTALLFTLLLASNAARFLRARFFLSAWAYSFPLAAVTIASLLMAHSVGGWVFEWISMGLIAVLTLIVVALVVRTLIGISRHELCVEEP
jgi:tellurite resistance protein